MSSNNTTFTPVWNKFHSTRPRPNPIPARYRLPPRPATSPSLPTPPTTVEVEKDGHDLTDTISLPKSPRADHRWSEVVPPATALTFAAVWDPEEGLITFGGASLSASENGGNNVSPDDADGHSQVLTVNAPNLEASPNTAQDSFAYPYSHSRFAASEVSTQRFPVSPTRRSSAGTGLALDTCISRELSKQMKGNQTLFSLPSESGTPRHARANHQHSSSQDSTVSNGLAAFGSGLRSAFRRVTPSKENHSRAERYAFLRRTAGRIIENSVENGVERDEKMHMRTDLIGASAVSGPSTPTKSAGLRSLFARSIWHRGDIGSGHDGRFICNPQIEDDHDGITLDSGFDHIDVDEDTSERWYGEVGGGHGELDNALRRDVNQLKSTFSWTTTSTSRYIDVAAYLDMDSDTDSTVSSLGAPIASTVSPFRSGKANSDSVHANEGGYDNSWLPDVAPTPRPEIYAAPQPRPQRKLVRKSSKTRVACPSMAKAKSCSKLATSREDQQGYQICPQCDLPIECADLEVGDEFAKTEKGKGRATSQPDPPDYIRNTVSFGRPAAVRSSSSPASVQFPHARSRSLPGSGTASPAEVLARASYNHEWPTPVPSRPISHARSPSTPQQRSSSTAMSIHRTTTPTRTCHHMADMRDVLRGVRSGIRPSTPIPGMPPVPPKNRPPPTSYRPVSAGGRDRTRSRTPMSSSAFASHSELVHPLIRSQSHRTSSDATSRVRSSRTRSLESLRGTAQALASASTAPLRSFWRSRSFIRNAHSDQPERSDADEEEDDVWVCVDIKMLSDKRKATLSTEGENAIAGPSKVGGDTNAPGGRS